MQKTSKPASQAGFLFVFQGQTGIVPGTQAIAKAKKGGEMPGENLFDEEEKGIDPVLGLRPKQIDEEKEELDGETR